MTTFTRRTLVKGGTALAATGALTGPAVLDWAKAWAQTAPWKPEKGAHAAHAALSVKASSPSAARQCRPNNCGR